MLRGLPTGLPASRPMLSSVQGGLSVEEARRYSLKRRKAHGADPAPLAAPPPRVSPCGRPGAAAVRSPLGRRLSAGMGKTQVTARVEPHRSGQPGRGNFVAIGRNDFLFSRSLCPGAACYRCPSRGGTERRQAAVRGREGKAGARP